MTALPETKEKPPVTATTLWQEWAKKRARNALPLERVRKITKKVKVKVTRRVVEERRGE